MERITKVRARILLLIFRTSQECQRTAQQQSKGIAQNFAGFFLVSCTPLDGKQWYTAIAEEGGESHNEGDNGKGQTYTGQSQTVAVPHMAQIDSVYHIVQ